MLWDAMNGLAEQPREWTFLAATCAEAGHPKVPLEGNLSPQRRFTKASLREMSVLLNSAGRCSEPVPEAALALLARSDSPRDLLDDISPELDTLADARAEVMRAVGQWSRTRPRFMWRVALVPVASPCRIEPILAAMWERQLERYMVVVANSGVAADRVAIVARTSHGGRNLLKLLDAVTPKELDRLSALGCRNYVEAVIGRKLWTRMLERMHFRGARGLVPPPQEATLF
jgi:hypothetical protein